MLRNLTRINKPLRITLEQMMRLIEQCDLLDPTKVKPNEVRLRTFGINDGDINTNGIQTTTSNSLYSGILPGKYQFCTRILRVSFCLFKVRFNFEQVNYVLNYEVDMTRENKFVSVQYPTVIFLHYSVFICLFRYLYTV